ncbi:MAG: DUF971 domain-containing protein [Verrucomicrobiota bacterium]
MSKIKKVDAVELIGTEVAVKWSDGAEMYYPMSLLRRFSPSAENQGEPDLLGNIIGGAPDQEYADVTVTGWDLVGGYAIRFLFSDGHSTGLYSYDYLMKLWSILENNPSD